MLDIFKYPTRVKTIIPTCVKTIIPRTRIGYEMIESQRGV